MKRVKDQLKEIDWEDIQEKHNNGKRLYELGISRKVINAAVIEGLFTKFKIPLVMSDDTKSRMSEARKKWLSENPK